MTEPDRIQQAINLLADTLAELSYTDRVSIKPPIRLLMAPGGGVGNDPSRTRFVGLTPELVELLAEAAEHLISRRAVVSKRVDPIKAQLAAQIFAMARPELAAEIDNAFAGVDLAGLTQTYQQNTEDGEDGTE